MIPWGSITAYVESIERGRAPVFLDTAMEGAPFHPDREIHGHERCPEIAGTVRCHSFQSAELLGARLFLHRGQYEARAGIQSWCAGLRF